MTFAYGLEPEFAGRIGPTLDSSSPWWPARAPLDAPHVIVVVLDDVGFAQLGCYGSSIRTPTMDRLAAQGLQYTNFHVTGLCSTTRACLLTGRNHHGVGVGFLTDYDTGFPNYRGFVSHRAATIADVLGARGYGTSLAGKWHLTPPAHMSPAGPFEHWPTQRGFDRFYGFLWGEDDQWSPELWYDQHRVEPELSHASNDNYHLSVDLVDRACAFIADHVSTDPRRPFFHYLAFGACHAPHQAPAEWIDGYRGAFDHGWDVERERVMARQIAAGIVPPSTTLAPRNPGVRAWVELSADEQRLAARLQEAFAGFMSHTDAQLARLVSYLERYELLENTVILLMSDNGASGEGGEHGSTNEYRYFLGLADPLEDSLAGIDEIGGPYAHNHYPAGWAQAGNTPLRFYKKHTYSGGVRAPLIIHWPAGISEGQCGLRHQFHHAIDLAPTLAELAGAEFPATHRGVSQLPVDGVSLRYTFTEPDATSTRTRQYFETAGYRGIYADGWKAVANHEPGKDFNDDHWGLYRLADDFSESHDLATQHPETTAELVQCWWSEAKRYGVLPLDDRMGTRVQSMDPATDRRRYLLLPGSRLLNGVVGPNFGERPFRIVARCRRTAPDHDGVLLAFGRRASGFSLFIKNNRLHFDFNLAGAHTLVVAERELVIADSDQWSELAVTVEMDTVGSGVVARLWCDDQLHGENPLPQWVPGGLGTMSVQCGHNSPSPVSLEYLAPARFGGELHSVVVELGDPIGSTGDPDYRAAIAQQ